MFKKSLLYRIFFFSFLSAVIIAGSIFIVSVHNSAVKNNIKLSEDYHLKIIKNSLRNEINGIINDLFLTVEDNTFQNFINNKSVANYNALCYEFSTFAEQKKIYDQIRLINLNGKEIVRVNFKNGKPSVVPKKDLQDKKNRYYFKKAIKLGNNQVYVSPLDLNIEHGKIEKPDKLTLRFCTPVFNRLNNKVGIVVLNFFGNQFLSSLEKTKHPDMLGSIMLINKNGLFLKPDNKAQVENKPKHEDSVFEKYYPEEWKVIRENPSGNLLTENGLFTYISLVPNEINSAVIKTNKTPVWFLISHIPNEIIDNQLGAYEKLVVSIDVLLFLIIFGFAFSYLKYDKERKKQQKEIEQREKKFRTIIDYAGDAMFIADLDGYIVDANKQACKNLGYSKKELIGKNVANIDHVFVEKDHINTLWKKFELAKPVTFEAKHKRKDGSIFPVEINAVLIEIENNKYILGFARDITERKNAERKLERYFEALNEAQKLGNLGFYERNVNTNEGFWSDGLYEIFGFEPGEVPALQESYQKIVHPDDLQMVKEKIEESLQKHQPSDIIHRIIRKDGEIRFMRAICEFVYDNNGKPLLHRGTFTDITKRKMLLDSVSESESKFRTAFDLNPDTLSILSLKDLRYLDVNNKFCLLSGYTKEEIIGKTVTELKFWTDTSLKDNFKRMLKKSQRIENIELEFRVKSGEKKMFLFSAEVYEDKGEHKILAIAKDITERKKQEKVEKVLSKISEYALTTDDIFGFIQKVHLHINEIIEAPNLSIALYHEDTDEYSFPYFIDERASDKRFPRMKLKNGCNDYVRRNRKPLFANKEKFEKLMKTGEIKLIGQNSKLWLGVPLITSSGVIGVMAIQHYTNPNAYSKNDLEMLNSISGNVARVIERTQLINMIKQSEQHFRQLFDFSPAGILIENDKGIIIDVNKTYCDISGFTKDELIGKHISFVSQKKSKEKISKNIEQILNGKSLEQEVLCVNKDGSFRTTKLLETRILFPDGKYGILSVADDISALKETEQILRNSEEKYKNLVESSTFGIVIHTKGIVQYANKAAQRIFESESLEDFDGKNVMDFIHHDYHNIVKKRIADTGEQKVISRALEEKFITFKGNSIDVEVVSIPITYNGVASNQVVFYDITKRKKAQDELIEKENYVQSVFCNIHENIFIMNSDYEIVDVNRKVLLESNYTKEEVIGKHCYEISHRNDKPCNLCGEDCYLEKVFATGSPFNYRHVHLSKNGEEKHVDIMMSPLMNKNGKVIKVIEAMRDITDIIVAEREMHKSEAKFRQLFENNLAGVFETTQEGTILMCNNRFAEIYGYKSSNELIGKSAFDLYTNNKHRDKFITDLRREKVILAEEYEMKKKDGTKVWILENSAILDSGNIYGTEIDITERKKVIKELEESEKKFKLIFDEANDAIYLYKINKNAMPTIYMVNKTACKNHGYTLDELIGKPVSFLDAESSKKTIEPNFKRIMNGEFLTFEVKHIRKNGSEFPVEITAHAVTIFDEKYIIVIARDITERYENAKALKESERKFKLLTESSPFGIIVHENGILKYANRAAKQILQGKVSKSYEGLNVFDFVHPDYKTSAMERAKEIIASGKAKRTTDEKYITLKGDIIDVDETAIPLNIIGKGSIQVIFTDITERKRLQTELEEYRKNLEQKVLERTKELKESEDKYRVLAETSDAFIARMDSNGKLLYANNALLSAAGKSSMDVIGKDHSEITNKEKSGVMEKLQSLISKTLAENISQRMEMKVPWGGWVEWHFTSESKKTGKSENVVIIGYDVTQKRKAQQKLQSALEKEKSVNDLKTQFISTVSHEFRTPLTSMFSSIELLERYGEKWDNVKKGNHFRTIKDSIGRLTEMLEDVLLLSRVEHRTIKLNLSKTNLKELCTAVVDNIKPLLLETHNLIFNYQLKEDEYLLDKKLVVPILSNLISNAVKYSPGGGEIYFSVIRRKDKLKFVISDEGYGISKTDVKKLFKEFFRSETVEHIKGTGLGLSIVKKYIEIHNGTVSVTSELGKGTEFTVLIPVDLK